MEPRPSIPGRQLGEGSPAFTKPKNFTTTARQEAGAPCRGALLSIAAHHRVVARCTRRLALGTSGVLDFGQRRLGCLRHEATPRRRQCALHLPLQRLRQPVTQTPPTRGSRSRCCRSRHATQIRMQVGFSKSQRSSNFAKWADRLFTLLAVLMAFGSGAALLVSS